MSYMEGYPTFIATSAIEANRIVKISSGTVTDPPQIEHAGSGETGIGVSMYQAAAGDRLAVRLWNQGGIFEIECTVDSAIARGATLYGGAAGVCTDTAVGSAIGLAAELGVDYKHIKVIPYSVKSTTAATVSVLDSGSYTAQTTVEAALAEIYAHLKSAKGQIWLPTPSFSAAGVAIAAFADGAYDVPGYCVTAEGLGIRWNNHAAPLGVGYKFLMPLDCDTTANMILNIVAAKTGATEGDATTFDVTAYNNVVGALYDADSNFGGTSSAMTGTATAKTVQKVTLTLALANLAAVGSVVDLTIKPTAGTLGTDDVIMFGVYITYTKTLTS